MDRLVLIDGNAMLHRAYHALPPLTSPDGAQVNAVYGFAAMLIRLVKDFRPTHMAVAFDRAAPTFRKKLYKEYQATRPKMDEELVSQVDLVHELVKSFGIAIFELDGFEADDIIGTMTNTVHSSQFTVHRNKIDQVIVVTGDRDILQLVEDEKVLVYMPTKGLSEGKLYGEREVAARLGVLPKLIPDLKALMGDSSDNYPGVAGIGPKTAVELLRAFGNIDHLFKFVNGIKNPELGIKNYGKDKLSFSGNIITKLRAGDDDAKLSYDLATIRRDVPINLNPEALKISSFDTTLAHAFLEKLHFYSLIKRLTNSEAEDEKRLAKPKQVAKKPDESGEQLSLV